MHKKSAERNAVLWKCWTRPGVPWRRGKRKKTKIREWQGNETSIRRVRLVYLGPLVGLTGKLGRLIDLTHLIRWQKNRLQVLEASGAVPAVVWRPVI